MLSLASPYALATAGRLTSFTTDLRAMLSIDSLLLDASIALATIGLLGWPAYAGELASKWIGRGR